MKNLFYGSVVFLGSTASVFAAPPSTDNDNIKSGFFQNPLQAKSLPALIDSLASVVLQLGVIVAALSIMYGGFMYVTAQGNEEKLASAQKTITWSLVGTAILIGAKVIIKVITGTIGEIAQDF